MINQNFTIKIPDTISEDILIIELKKIYLNYMIPCNHSIITDCINTIKLDWIILKGDYTGTMPKRVSKFFKKVYNIKADCKILSDFGEVLSRGRVNDSVKIIIDRDFVWRDGDWGDSGSCFWSFNTAHRAILASPKNINCFAVKIRSDINNKRGRCWLIDINGQLMIFNNYGDYSLIAIARMIALKFGYSYTKSDSNFNDNIIYLNRTKFYAIYKDNFVNIDYIELLSPEAFCPECGEYFKYEDFNTDSDSGAFGCSCCVRGMVCDNCGDGINEDECLYNDNGEAFCEDCFCELYIYCNECSEVVYRNDSYTGSDNCEYCEGCFNDKFITCDECEEPVLIEDSYNHEDYNYCQDCFDNNFTICEYCEDYINKNDILIGGDDNNYCQDCFDLYTICKECGDWILKSDSIKGCQDLIFCEYCFNKIYYYFDFLIVIAS